MPGGWYIFRPRSFTPMESAGGPPIDSTREKPSRKSFNRFGVMICESLRSALCLKVYLNAIADTFGNDVDYAVLHKIYGKDQASEARYSPPTCIGCEKKQLSAIPIQS